MNKFTSLLGILMLLSLSCAPNNIQEPSRCSDLEEIHLSGPVSSIQQSLFTLNEQFGEPNKGNELGVATFIAFHKYEKFYSAFNESGCTTVLWSYDAEGNRIESRVITYASETKKVEQTLFMYKKDGSRIKTVSKYRDNGTIREAIKTDQEGAQIAQILYSYDKDLNATEIREVNADSVVTIKMTYDFDEKGNLIEENTYFPDLGTRIKISSSYDDQNKLVKREIYNPTGALDSSHEFNYNKTGTVYSDIFYLPDMNTKGFVIYDYDTTGLVIQQDLVSYHRYWENGEYKFNEEAQNLIATGTYEYKFDEYGNWTQLLLFTDEKPSYMIERDIKYSTNED